MPLSAGTKLGPYEILSAIGAGGMGQVYKARDTRLKRDVALKILPADVSGDLFRRQRFEQEARAVAALNHPNIVAIYDVGEENSVHFIVTELVDGESLRGAKLGLRKVLDCATQIASGLGAAHAAGITHRDLKPDNILLTTSGQIKILDFGLAKMNVRRSPGDTTETVLTETLAFQTEPGVVMGTVGYMSPEQIRGEPTDARSDIFSFGLVLFELLAGRRAFHAATAAETMTAILTQEPPELPETVPSGVRQVVHHCLEKRAENRFQSARDLSFAVGAMSQVGLAQQLPAVSPWRKRAMASLGAVVLVAAGLGTMKLWMPAPAAPTWNAVYLGGPEVTLAPRLSPDGHTIAFLTLVGEFVQIGIMRPETGSHLILTRSRDQGFIQGMNWSTDGSKIYYDRWTDVPRGIYSVPTLGGEERSLLEDAAFGDVISDGSMLVTRLNAEGELQLFRFWPDTGRLQSLAMGGASVAGGAFNYNLPVAVFPDGREAVTVGSPIGSGKEAGRHLYKIDLTSGASRRLPTGLPDDSNLGAIAATRDGQSVVAFAAGANGAFRVLEVPRSGRTPGRTLFPVTRPATSLDTGADGSVYLDQQERPLELLRFPAQGGHVDKIAVFPLSAGDDLALLSDERVFVQQSTAGRDRLMVVEAGKDPVPLVNTEEETAAPATAAGPGEVAFLIGPPPRRTIAMATVSNGRVTRRIEFNHGLIASLASSPDGKTLYCAAEGVVWSITVAGGEAKKIRPGNAVAVDPAGQFLLVEVIENPRIRLVRVPLNGGAEQEIPQAGPLRPASIIGPNAIGKDGRIVMPLGTPSWYWPPGLIDPATGKFTRIPVDYLSDYHVLGWTQDGKVMAEGLGISSTMWRFTPERR